MGVGGGLDLGWCMLSVSVCVCAGVGVCLGRDWECWIRGFAGKGVEVGIGHFCCSEQTAGNSLLSAWI